MTRVPANRYVCFFTLAILGVFVDLYSKLAVFRDLGFPHQASAWKYEWFSGWMTFRLYTSFNPGALWGIGQGYTWVFAALSVVAVVGVSYWLFIARGANSWWLTISLAFIMAGTLGNLYDRVTHHGYIDKDQVARPAVRDFLLFTFGDFSWPVFNFADVFLVTGAIMLIVHSFRIEESAQSTTSESDDGKTEVEQPTTDSNAPSIAAIGQVSASAST